MYLEWTKAACGYMYVSKFSIKMWNHVVVQGRPLLHLNERQSKKSTKQSSTCFSYPALSNMSHQLKIDFVFIYNAQHNFFIKWFHLCKHWHIRLTRVVADSGAGSTIETYLGILSWFLPFLKILP